MVACIQGYLELPKYMRTLNILPHIPSVLQPSHQFSGVLRMEFSPLCLVDKHSTTDQHVQPSGVFTNIRKPMFKLNLTELPLNELPNSAAVNDSNKSQQIQIMWCSPLMKLNYSKISHD